MFISGGMNNAWKYKFLLQFEKRFDCFCMFTEHVLCKLEKRVI